MAWTIGLPTMTLDLRQHFYLDHAPYDTIINFSQKSTSSWSVGGGYYFNLVKFNKKTSFALDASLYLTIYQWNMQKAKYAGLENDDANAKSIMLELPIALLYKYGGEVNFDREHRFLFSAGGGIAPSFVGSSYSITNSGGMKFRPFVIAEAGAFWGIATKLRATYYPVSTEYIRDSAALPLDDGTVKVVANGTGNFMLSLLIYIYSSRWGDE